MKSSLLVVFISIAMMLCVRTASAIDLAPTSAQIEKVIRQGQETAGPGGQIMNVFGEMGECGWGFLQTRLWTIWAESKMASTQFKPYSSSNPGIQEAISQETMVITYVHCADEAAPQDLRLVLKQGDKVIEPTKVSLDVPKPTSHYPSPPAYSSTLMEQFPYPSFSATAATEIIVIMESGKRLTFKVNFSEMP